MLILDVRYFLCKKGIEVRVVFKYLKYNYYDCFKSIYKCLVFS